ncbi:MAG: hypothetical protein HS115_00370 [Spirochaetales bacterium]|nr:hypothetical protein [Spirochaetales bacterium]
MFVYPAPRYNPSPVEPVASVPAGSVRRSGGSFSEPVFDELYAPAGGRKMPAEMVGSRFDILA